MQNQVMDFVNSFKNVTLFSEKTLGIGSYGKVCKAKCDDLLCAAKILHPTLYDPSSTQQMKESQTEYMSRLPMQRFEQECRVMSTIRHPNIVQYLGVYHEPGTALPVLLMELMDQSLTRFVEKSMLAIPYHVQVDLCHDIALALSFLHSNDIIHRDLSSNNVLLTSGYNRAKVSDFGMARLGEISAQLSRGSFTKCPGTDAYMPPEAVQTNPVYTEKIDCFSFGVLAVQILTRQFPNPNERHKMVQVNDPQFPSGEIKVCISEIERRQNHISKIDSKHPLLPLALECLNDRDIERPTAHKLCLELETLKTGQLYKSDVAVSAAKMENGLEIDDTRDKEEEEHVEEKDREIFQLRYKLRQALLEHGESLRSVEQKERELEESKQLLEEYQRMNFELQNQLEHKCDDQPKEKDADSAEISRSSRRMDRDMTQIQQQAHKVRDIKKLIQSQEEMLEEKELSIKQKERAIEQLESGIAAKDQVIHETNAMNDQIVLTMEKEILQLKQQLLEKNLSKEGPAETKDVRLSYVSQQLALSEQTVLHFQRRISELEERLRSQECPREQPQSLLEDSCEKDESTLGDKCRLQLQWREGRRAPREMCRWSDAVTTDGTVYFRLLNTHKVYAYIVQSKEWTRLPDSLYHSCPLAVINNTLTAIGGYYHGYYNQLISFIGKGSEKKWTEILPPMPTKRSGAIALNSGSDLVVAGGQGKDGKLTTVEVMNLESFQWSTACPLLEPVYNASATLCADSFLYMLGGYDKDDIATRSVYTCSLMDLVRSCRRMSLGRRLKKAFTSLESTDDLMSVWRRVADLPVSDSTCVSVRGRVIAIGGKNSDKTPTSAIRAYNSSTKSWEIVSQMLHPIGRYQCFAAVLPNDQLMVVGGWTANERASTSIEYAVSY